MVTTYYVGQNIPGYLPMEDEPYGHSTFEGAKAELIDMLLRAEDAYEQMAEDYNQDEQMAEACSNAAQEVNLWNSPDTIYVCSDEPHDLGLAFWIVEEEEGDD